MFIQKSCRVHVCDMSHETLIRERIVAALAPTSLQVTVVDAASQKYHVRVVSEQFTGKSLVQRHKLVNATVKQELLSESIHALQIDAVAPGEP